MLRTILCMTTLVSALWTVPEPPDSLRSPAARCAAAPRPCDPTVKERRLTPLERYRGRPYLRSTEDPRRVALRDGLFPARADFATATAPASATGVFEGFPGAPTPAR